MTKPSARYIAIEGPIGVGKTSLVNLIGERLGAAKILEKVQENPFLPQFYSDRRKFAFQTQMFFLLSRYNQLVELQQMDLFHTWTVADYCFAKDRLFAYMNLSDHELELYEQVHAILNERIVPPDLMIYLQAGPDVLMKRIKGRARSYEKNLTKEYVESLHEAYEYFFFHYRETPLLVIKTSEIDFVRSGEDLEDLIQHIMEMDKGTHYYAPLSTRDKKRHPLPKDTLF